MPPREDAREFAEAILRMRPGSLVGTVWEATLEDATNMVRARDQDVREAVRRAIDLLTGVVDEDGNVDHESIDAALEDLRAAVALPEVTP